MFLQRNCGAGMHVIQLPVQGFLQDSILLCTGAVSGVILGGEFYQLMQRAAQLTAPGIHPDKMETAEENIRTEPA